MLDINVQRALYGIAHMNRRRLCQCKSPSVDPYAHPDECPYRRELVVAWENHPDGTPGDAEAGRKEIERQLLYVASAHAAAAATEKAASPSDAKVSADKDAADVALADQRTAVIGK